MAREKGGNVAAKHKKVAEKDSEIQKGNYPSGSKEIEPLNHLGTVLNKLSEKLSQALHGALMFPNSHTGLTTEEVRYKDPEILKDLKRRALRSIPHRNNNVPTFFTEDGRQIKTEFMIGALEVIFTNSINLPYIPPARLLAISGDYPLYTSKGDEVYKCVGGNISRVKIFQELERSKRTDSKITHEISKDKKRVSIKADITCSVKIERTDGDQSRDYSGEIVGTFEGILGEPTKSGRDAISGVISSSTSSAGTIVGKIYSTAPGNQCQDIEARVENLAIRHGQIKFGKIVVKNGRRRLFEFQYDGFILINDIEFHNNLKKQNVYNLFAEALPDVSLTKSCAAQKLFAYLNFANARNKLAGRCTSLKEIERISMYETWFRDGALVADPTKLQWSSTSPVNSCRRCKPLLPALTMRKEHITDEMIERIKGARLSSG